MGLQASFQQILESKIKIASDPRDLNKSPQQDFEPAHLAYLMGHIRQTFFHPPPQLRVHKIYPSPPRPPHTLSEEQQVAVSFFLFYGASLSPAFPQKELKKAFRALALKLHPDMNKGATSAFIELKNNYEMLNKLFC
ncbi:MAG TPA: DnaJ domain-containing protein [Pseudobdellovibrionaceae bacterium]|jgi:hypothetical protein